MWWFLLLAAAATAVRYDGHKVMRLVPKTEYEVAMVNSLKMTMGTSMLDFWSDHIGVERPVMVRVPPEHEGRFNVFMRRTGVQYEVAMADVQQVIDSQGQASLSVDPRNINFEEYNRHGVIDGWLDHIANECGSRCSLHTLGTSHGGRPMRAIRITGTTPANRNIWIDAGIHAREWISPATALWLIRAFVRDYNQPNIKAAVDKFNWYILPVANPDGYEYSHTDDRMWRKTRVPYGDCYGADPNRNWSYEWGGAGTSPDSCSAVYHGPAPFSEPCCARIRDFVNTIKGNTAAFLSYHSFGQWWLTPWGYTLDDPPNYDEQLRVGQATVDAIQAVRGTEYLVGATAQILYMAAGGSGDWAYGDANIQYSYIPELPDTGFYGFILPSEEIRPVGEETLQGMLAMAAAIP